MRELREVKRLNGIWNRRPIWMVSIIQTPPRPSRPTNKRRRYSPDRQIAAYTGHFPSFNRRATYP